MFVWQVTMQYRFETKYMSRMQITLGCFFLKVDISLRRWLKIALTAFYAADI